MRPRLLKPGRDVLGKPGRDVLEKPGRDVLATILNKSKMVRIVVDEVHMTYIWYMHNDLELYIKGIEQHCDGYM
jgi:hypothetical protein